VRQEDTDVSTTEPFAVAGSGESADAERVAWIAAHGSPRLQKGHAGGYDMTGLYLTERAAVEHPGAVLDYYGEVSPRDRVSPTERALDLAAEKGGRVVWITVPPRPFGMSAEKHTDLIVTEYGHRGAGEEAVAVDYLDDRTVYYLLGDPQDANGGDD
jgi:hypothetical protein